MIKFQSKITGFQDFSKLLNQLPQKIENNVLQKATLEALAAIQTEMEAAMPRDLEGQSQASQKYGRADENIKVIVLRKAKKKGRRGARISTGDAFWMYFYEIGTSHQPARPVFLPAFRKLSTAVISQLTKSISAGINREIGK